MKKEIKQEIPKITEKSNKLADPKPCCIYVCYVCGHSYREEHPNNVIPISGYMCATCHVQMDREFVR